MKLAKNEGIIFDIKRYAIHDGPGIRTTVFFKGCPLSCWWCHNPESRALPVEKFTLADKKTETVGRKITCVELIEIIKKDLIFYEESGGGVTFGGGEPLMQPEFLLTMLKRSKEEGLHTAVDTTGYASWPVLEKTAEFIDLFLYDIKLLDEELHIKYTGVSNKIIIENLRRLLEMNKKVVLRMPIIPGITNSIENLRQFKEFISSLPTRPPVEFLNFNIFAPEKYRRFNFPFHLTQTEPIADEEFERLTVEFNSIS